MGRALIVSAGANSNEYIAARLSEMGYSRPVIIPSGAEARRRMSESDFELIVVNAPLPDEFGHELCITAVEQTDAGVVFLVKAAQAEQLLAPLNEQGVLLLSKPFTTPLFLQAMHMAAASNHRLQRLRQENARLQASSGRCGSAFAPWPLRAPGGRCGSRAPVRSRLARGWRRRRPGPRAVPEGSRAARCRRS